jgi:hypothetical protein
VRDTDAGGQVGYREIRQVAAVAAVDGRGSADFFSGNNPDLMSLAGLQLVDELFLVPLLPHFLGVQVQKRPLDDHAALQSEILLYQVPHGPWVHLMMSCQMPYASLRICSQGPLDLGDGGDSPDSSLTSVSQPWHDVLTIILQLFDFETRLLLSPSLPQIWRWCWPARTFLAISLRQA